MAKRSWEALTGLPSPLPVQRDHETGGYVIEGSTDLRLEEQRSTLEPGDSWRVSKDAVHRYPIREAFIAIESTAPPARIHDRDSPHV
jgi:quercetin dioxygenase-like cupin family protein